MEAEDGKAVHTGRTAWFSSGHFEHSLLLAMPLPDGVDGGLDAIQRLVSKAIEPSADLRDTVQAVQELGEAVRRGSLTDGDTLAIEVVDYVMRRLSSPRLAMCLVTFDLRRSGMRLTSDGPPTIVMATGKPLGEVSVPGHALESLEAAAQELSSYRLEDLKALGDDECRAAIQVVALHAQYSLHLERDLKHELRLNYLRCAGLAVWKLALEALSEDAKRASSLLHRFGRPAYRQVRAALLRAANGHVVAEPVRQGSHRATTDGYHRILLEDIPEGSARDERKQLEKYKLLSRPLQVAKAPGLDHLLRAEDRLVAEFPWARDAIVVAFRELMARSAFGAKRLGLSPLLFVGPPGLGKSRLARRIAEELGVLLLSIPFGSASDSHMLNGVSRGWSTGQASPILTLMLTKLTPSLVILADEIDKSRGHYANSASPHTSLLALLEPETARSWLDQYLQARCDLTSLLFIATANDVEALPGPLLNRFTVLHFSKPDPRDLLLAVGGVLDDVAREWHVPRDRLPVLTGTDLEGPFSDMRDVRRAVLRALADRANPRPSRKSVIH